MANREGTRPTHVVKLSNKHTRYSNEIGVAWEIDGKANSKGLSIKLHPGVVLSHRDMEDYFLTIWPERRSSWEGKPLVGMEDVKGGEDLPGYDVEF